MDLTQKDQLIQYLKQHGLWAKKSMGQNFLVDREVLDGIVAAAELSNHDTVLEIGPGVGTLTGGLVQRADRVVAVEKDERLAGLLNCYIAKLLGNKKEPTTIRQLNNLTIISGDALELDPESIVKGSHKLSRDDKGEATNSTPVSLEPETLNLKPVSYKLVANIPYYITSKILEKFLSAEHKPSLIVLLVQKEVAERICSKIGNLSLLAVSVQYYGEPELVSIVKRDSFFPAPTVDSAILKIKINNQKPKTGDEKEFFKTVKMGFQARRKTLFNNLKAGTHLNSRQIEAILDKMGLSRNVRAQELTIAQWQELAGHIKLKGKS